MFLMTVHRSENLWNLECLAKFAIWNVVLG